MLSKSYTGQKPDPLVDGTLDVLEREHINEGAVRCRGVGLQASLKG